MVYAHNAQIVVKRNVLIIEVALLHIFIYLRVDEQVTKH